MSLDNSLGTMTTTTFNCSEKSVLPKQIRVCRLSHRKIPIDLIAEVFSNLCHIWTLIQNDVDKTLKMIYEVYGWLMLTELENTLSHCRKMIENILVYSATAFPPDEYF